MPIKSVLSGVASSAWNPVGTGLTALAIDGMEGMNKDPVNPVIPSEKSRRRALSLCLENLKS